jgi:hypothetical protein
MENEHTHRVVACGMPERQDWQSRSQLRTRFTSRPHRSSAVLRDGGRPKIFSSAPLPDASPPRFVRLPIIQNLSTPTLRWQLKEPFTSSIRLRIRRNPDSPDAYDFRSCGAAEG